MKKRVFDFLVSLILLVALFPFLILLALLIGIGLGRPIFFTQTRPGLHAKPFKIIKFRSMKTMKDAQGNELADEQRITRFGQFLRSTSLDELPELWNVLKGEMSLVGPRPLLMDYLPLYTPQQSSRHQVKPGITGWAQINGRNAIHWEEKFNLDRWYVDNQSFWLDMSILFLTLKQVIVRKDINSKDHVTTEKFSGTFKS